METMEEKLEKRAEMENIKKIGEEIDKTFENAHKQAEKEYDRIWKSNPVGFLFTCNKFIALLLCFTLHLVLLLIEARHVSLIYKVDMYVTFSFVGLFALTILSYKAIMGMREYTLKRLVDAELMKFQSNQLMEASLDGISNKANVNRLQYGIALIKELNSSEHFNHHRSEKGGNVYRYEHPLDKEDYFEFYIPDHLIEKVKERQLKQPQTSSVDSSEQTVQ